jgi:hypothetical protein
VAHSFFFALLKDEMIEIAVSWHSRWLLPSAAP